MDRPNPQSCLPAGRSPIPNPSAKPIVVIVGPTASGKSAVALSLAKKIDGEIVCADSRTIYKNASIGTAKPTKVERDLVPHHGLDLVNLGDNFTAHDFQNYAKKAVQKIRAKNKVPIIVGGTGLYIDGFIYNFGFRPSSSPKERSKLNNLSIDELKRVITDKNLEMPNNDLNKRHLIRAIETEGQQPIKQKISSDVIYTGLLPSDKTIKASIDKRVDQMYNLGFLDEVLTLKKVYTAKQVSSAGIGYQSAMSYINGELDIDRAKELFKTGDWQLARRQKTWFKRNPDIAWFSTKKALQTHILSLLSK